MQSEQEAGFSAAPAAGYDAVHPYSEVNGRIIYTPERSSKKDGAPSSPQVVCDLTARIAQDISVENGGRSFIVEGRSAPRYDTKGNPVPGAPFDFEIPAAQFSNVQQLTALLTNAAGAHSPVRAGMEKHLRAAIPLLSGEISKIYRFERTGWAKIYNENAGREENRFLLPNRHPSNVQVKLPRKLPYGANPDADFETGLSALESLLRAQRIELSTVAVAFQFQAVMAGIAGWRNERYALAIVGRTGSLKTSWTQCAMALHGQKFMSDELIIKWGEGATRNAVMRLASHAYDVPFLIDNYKPTTGGGARDFVNLMHNILEGGEKDRLNRSSGFQESRSVFCWPIVTGEDVPDSDAASLARVLVIPFAWQRGEDNPFLLDAQNNSMHLSSVMNAWIAWLETPEGWEAAKAAGKQFAARRSYWAMVLRGTRKDMANVLRVASNLASNELTWHTMTLCPALKALCENYKNDHAAGLCEVAGNMAHHTAESLEAIRFIEALRELLASGMALIVPPDSQPADVHPERIIGYTDGKGGAFLLPQKARAAVDKLLGNNGLGQMTARTLHSQLDALGFVIKRGGEMTHTVRTYEGTPRCLHLCAAALSDDANED